MSRHEQRRFAMMLIYMHLLRDVSFDRLIDSLREGACIEKLHVIVEDSDEQSVPNVKLKLFGPKRNKTYEAKSNKDGVCVFKNIMSGDYVVQLAQRDVYDSHRKLFGIEDAIVSPVEKDEPSTEKKQRYKHAVNQLTTDSIIVSLPVLIEDEVEIIISVDTFIPYTDLDDGFINVLYRVEDRLEIYASVIESTLKQSWKFDRLGFIEQAILLLACAELEFGDAPKTIVVNEAVNLAKEFSDDDSYKLINGVLDAL